MRWPRICCALVLAAAVVGAVLRLGQLEQRPMHTDEAVHAVKFGQLLEDGIYRYDRDEYHGPTLNYLTLIPARLVSAGKLTEVRESTLRIVPVFFGVALVVLVLLLMDGLGGKAAVVAAILTAISPAFVYYSRYYIQETLLVCFTFGAIACGYRYCRNKHVLWALLTGAFLGLMHATKETCIIAFAAMGAALLLTVLTQRRQGKESGAVATVKATNPKHLAAMIGCAAVVSMLFYSSFLTNLSGISDAARAYGAYFHRASQNQLHIHPWHYYLKMLVCWRLGEGPIWSEGLIVFLAAVGLGVAVIKRHSNNGDVRLFRFLAFYTLIMIVVYSAIRYKTPWCMLGFLHGMILLAGVGAAAFLKASSRRRRTVVSVLLVAGGITLAAQAYLGSYKYASDMRNPYVYAHTDSDVFTIVQRVEEMAQADPNGFDMYVQVICPGDDYWPLPWYLRSFTKVSWQNSVDYALPIARMIVASPEVEAALIKKLYELPPPGEKDLYVYLFDSYVELRPQVELRGFVTSDLWDRFHQQGAGAADPNKRSQAMTQQQQGVSFDKNDWESIDGMHRFSHEAMATAFEIFVVHADEQPASQAAREAFAEIDRLEQELSRFIENSDVSRINKLRANESLFVSPATFECLQLGIRLYAQTGGAFDITVGHVKDKWVSNSEVMTPAHSRGGSVEQHTTPNAIKLDETRYAVTPASDGIRVDLGGIGKGFALDRMAEVLAEWRIETALVHGGGSTILAIGAPSGTKGWPVTLSDPHDLARTLGRLYLRNQAVSSSSMVHARHIIDPQTMRPVEGKLAAWACAPDAATADALSTAFVVMSPEQVEQYCENHAEVKALIISTKEQIQQILHFGPWKKDELL